MGYALSQLIIFLYLIPLSVVAQSGGVITLGSSLSANEKDSPWLSPSGDFAFGFQKLDNNLFLLSIWYSKIPEKTIVWYANEGTPVVSGSKVLLTERGLQLNGPRGEELWVSQPLDGGVVSGHMNDTGNFAILDENSQESWGSFDFPTDTLLPSQTIARGGEAVTSRKTEMNFSPGRFLLYLGDDGNLVLNTVNLPSSSLNGPYYGTGTDDATNSSNSGSQLVFNESGYLYVLRVNGQRFMLTQSIVPAGDFYHRVTLDFDGVLAQYYHPKNATGNETWSVLWSKPDNICTANPNERGSGTCGYNSICRLDMEQRPKCECPRGYSLLDPNDQYGSCKPNFTLGCEDGLGSAEELYDIFQMQSINWPLSDYQLLSPFSEGDCRNSCLHDCMCAVAIFGGGMCWKKKLPLSNGRSTNDASKALIKVAKGNYLRPNDPRPTLEPEKKKQHTLVILGSVLLGSSVLVLVICLGLCIIYKKKCARIQHTENTVDSNLHSFTYQELKEATGGFKEEIGRGAFGIVYQGEMNTIHGNLVAVKKLDKMVLHEGEKEFNAEVTVIGKTHHKNLVRLFGFCNEGLHRLLVYEYLGNGTLASFLFKDPKPSWSLRTEIALGIARGLLYLHEECSTQIIHCDIKPQNILLDENYNARISDFGLAKLLKIGQSHTHTAIRGTKGYVAPDWFRNVPITVKVDVYSFGILLLEIICCRRNVELEIAEESAILTDWAYDSYVGGTLDALVEHDIEAVSDQKKLARFVMVALWCIQEDFWLRPTMWKVIQMLEGVTKVSVPPSPSPLTSTIG